MPLAISARGAHVFELHGLDVRQHLHRLLVFDSMSDDFLYWNVVFTVDVPVTLLPLGCVGTPMGGAGRLKLGEFLSDGAPILGWEVHPRPEWADWRRSRRVVAAVGWHRWRRIRCEENSAGVRIGDDSECCLRRGIG